MPATVFQTLAVSALVAINESLIESGKLPPAESLMIRRVVASVRDAFDAPISTPVLIVAHDEEYEASLDRIGQTMGAAE